MVWLTASWICPRRISLHCQEESSKNSCSLLDLKSLFKPIRAAIIWLVQMFKRFSLLGTFLIWTPKSLQVVDLRVSLSSLSLKAAGFLECASIHQLACNLFVETMTHYSTSRHGHHFLHFEVCCFSCSWILKERCLSSFFRWVLLTVSANRVQTWTSFVWKSLVLRAWLSDTRAFLKDLFLGCKADWCCFQSHLHLRRNRNHCSSLSDWKRNMSSFRLVCPPKIVDQCLLHSANFLSFFLINGRPKASFSSKTPHRHRLLTSFALYLFASFCFIQTFCRRNRHWVSAS